jgi:hypothetical protein
MLGFKVTPGHFQYNIDGMRASEQYDLSYPYTEFQLYCEQLTQEPLYTGKIDKDIEQVIEPLKPHEVVVDLRQTTPITELDFVFRNEYGDDIPSGYGHTYFTLKFLKNKKD